MATSKIRKIPFGLKDGRLHHAEDVKRGLACECICPECGRPLQARQGKKVPPYFAHDSKSCESGYETAIHLASKQIIEDAGSIRLPSLMVCASKFDLDEKTHQLAYTLNEARNNYTLEQVTVERNLGNIRPDILAIIGGKELLIEVAVTHFVDDEKLLKIRKNNQAAIEIDLSSVSRNPNWEELRKSVLDINNTYWINNPKETEIRETLDIKIDKIVKFENELIELRKSKEKENAGKNSKQKDLLRDRAIEIITGIQNQKTQYNHTTKYTKEFLKHPTWPHLARNLNVSFPSELPKFMDHAIDGEWVFYCDRRLWQGLIFSYFVHQKLSSKYSGWKITPKLIDRWLNNWKIQSHPQLYLLMQAKKSGALPETIVEKVPNRWKVISIYLAHLAELGFLKRVWRGYVVIYDKLSIPTKEHYQPKTRIIKDPPE